MEQKEDQFEFIFRRKMGAFTEEPSGRVWEGVQKGLARRRRMPWLWIFPVIILAGFVLFHVPQTKPNYERILQSRKNPADKVNAQTNGMQKKQQDAKTIEQNNREESVVSGNSFLENQNNRKGSQGVAGVMDSNSESESDSRGRIADDSLVGSGVQPRLNVQHLAILTKKENQEARKSLQMSADSEISFEQPVMIGCRPLLLMTTEQLPLIGEGNAYVSDLPKSYMLPYSWSVDVVFVTGISWSQYSNKGVENIAFARGRDSSNVAYQFYDAGMRFQRSNRNGSFFSAGFFYGQRQDRFGFVYSFETPQTVIDSSKFITIIDPVLPPQIIRTYDTSLVVLRQSRKLQHEVSMQYFRVPLRTGFRFMQEKMIFSISGGVDLGWMRASGSVIDPVTMETFSLEGESVYRNTLLSDAVLSIAWEWKIAEKISFLAEPFFSKALTNLYRRDDFGSYRPFQAALLTGIRFKP